MGIGRGVMCCLYMYTQVAWRLAYVCVFGVGCRCVCSVYSCVICVFILDCVGYCTMHCVIKSSRSVVIYTLPSCKLGSRIKVKYLPFEPYFVCWVLKLCRLFSPNPSRVHASDFVHLHWEASEIPNSRVNSTHLFTSI